MNLTFNIFHFFNDLKNDDRAVAFGLFVFLCICATAILSYAVMKPIWEGITVEGAYDEEYISTYSSPEDLETMDWLSMLFEGTLFTMCVLAGAVMVINRSIYKGS